MSDPQTLNAYGYALNNPVGYNDPTGRDVGYDEQTGQVLSYSPGTNWQYDWMDQYGNVNVPKAFANAGTAIGNSLYNYVQSSILPLINPGKTIGGAFKAAGVSMLLAATFGSAAIADSALPPAGETTNAVTEGMSELTPAEQATDWQGKGRYPGVDNWQNTTISKGTIVWGGAPGQSNFYTTDETMQLAGNDATKIFEGLQSDKGYFPNYRPGMTQYMVTQDVEVAYSKALANPQYGNGGFEQYFIPNPEEVLQPVQSLILTNR